MIARIRPVARHHHGGRRQLPCWLCAGAAKHRQELIALMEGVEDIPEAMLAGALDWNWLSFPGDLDRLAKRQYTMDAAAKLTHTPLRVLVIGDPRLRRCRRASSNSCRSRRRKRAFRQPSRPWGFNLEYRGNTCGHRLN
jgi:hypothetical protein